MTLAVKEVAFFELPMETRLPFQYGIASVTHLPHLFVRVIVELNDKLGSGLSSENLAPKWFTKDPHTSFERHDYPQMMVSLRKAAELSTEPPSAAHFFDWWNQLYCGQMQWATKTDTPPLVAGLGVSLIERAVIDACCRIEQNSLNDWLRSEHHGIQPAALRPQTATRVAEILPPEPLTRIQLRHTVGLADPLTSADVTQRPDDGLPFTLEEHIVSHGLTHLKIKLSGEFDNDCDRLRVIRRLSRRSGKPVRFTLDGNENYRSMSQFRTHWEQLIDHEEIRNFLRESLLYVEQPVHRDEALAESVKTEFADWPGAPAVIIDESDADLTSFPVALDLGYSGTSHKNCKGVVKSLANLATIRATSDASRLTFSGEDLMNVGPIALHQDLAVCASLGISHAERNGHHYFRGLAHLSEMQQQQVLMDHPHLYFYGSEFVQLRITDGSLNIQDCVAAPFGYWTFPDLNAFKLLDDDS